MATAKPNQKIHVDKLQATLEKLEQLEKKQPLELTLRESIYLLRDKLRSALKKGYSYEDLSEILEAQGILVSAATLKQYLTESNKQTSKGKNRASKVETKLSFPQAPDKNILAAPESDTEKKYSSAASGEEEDDSSQSRNSTDDTTPLEQSEVNLLEKNNQASSVASQQDSKKPVRSKTKKLNSSSKDLSSEFNQY